MSVSKGHIICTLENLNYCFIFVYFNDTAKLFGTVIHTEGDDFLVGSVFNAFQNYTRAVYVTKASIVDCHKKLTSLSAVSL